MGRSVSAVAMAAAAAIWAVGAAAVQPASASAPVTPSHTAVAKLMAQAEEYTSDNSAGRKGATGEHLHQDGKAVVVPDGRGGWITAVPAVRWPTADGTGQLVLFWHNRTFVGSSSLGSGDNLGEEAVSVGIVRAGTNDIVLKYADYKPTDPNCCPSLPPVRIRYSWNGSRIVASAALPPGVLAKNLTIRL